MSHCSIGRYVLSKQQHVFDGTQRNVFTNGGTIFDHDAESFRILEEHVRGRINQLQLGVIAQEGHCKGQLPDWPLSRKNDPPEDLHDTFATISYEEDDEATFRFTPIISIDCDGHSKTRRQCQSGQCFANRFSNQSLHSSMPGPKRICDDVQRLGHQDWLQEQPSHRASSQRKPLCSRCPLSSRRTV